MTDQTVKLRHPDAPNGIDVSERKARLLTLQGWVRIDHLPPPPATTDTPDIPDAQSVDPDGLEA